MKIGINLLAIYEMTGIGVYARNMLAEFGAQDKEDEFVIFVASDAPRQLFLDAPNFEYVRLRGSARPGIARIVNLQCKLPFLVRHHGIHALFSPSVFIPLFVRCPQIVTMHDLIFLKGGRARLRSWYLKLTARAVARAERIVTVSEFSKKQICAAFSLPEKRVAVIYNGVDVVRDVDAGEEREFVKKYDLDGLPYFFYIGRVAFHKNIGRMVGTFQKFAKEFPRSRLFIAGKIAEDARDIRALRAAAETSGGKIIFLGPVSDLEKTILYRHSLAFLFLSLSEGFGLPVVESQRLGVPVLASNAAALPEIGGGGAYYVDPESEPAILDGMKKIFQNGALREQLIRNGSENAKRFSWQKAARSMLNIIH